MRHAWRVEGVWVAVGCAALLACGDDSSPGSSGTSSGGSNGAGGASTSSTSSTSSATSTSSSGGATGAGGSGNGSGCTPDPTACVADNLSCACKGDCTLCNDIECFTWGLEVACQNGIVGFSCSCAVDGQTVGSCNETTITCELETSCCQQFLVP